MPDWWDNLLTQPDAEIEPEDEMLRLIAYDIADPKRLHRVANACLDFGVRIQKSLFECWLDEDRFQLLWRRLQSEINPSQDRIIAYTLDANAVQRRTSAGRYQLTTQPTKCFIV